MVELLYVQQTQHSARLQQGQTICQGPFRRRDYLGAADAQDGSIPAQPDRMSG